MEYIDSRKNPLQEGLYRDKRDKSYVLYLLQEKGKWRFQTPGSEDVADFPIEMSRELEPIDNPVGEIERFRKTAGFLEKKVDEEIEERRRI